MKYTLGVDQSYTCTGYVLIDETGKMTKFGTFKTDKEKDIYARSLELAEFIKTLVKDNNVTDMRIEGLAFGGSGDATRNLAGLQFVVITNLRQAYPDTKVTIIAPTSLKKFATGSGKSDKLAMISAVPEAVMEEFVTAKLKKTSGLADVVDAYWLSKFKTA